MLNKPYQYYGYELKKTKSVENDMKRRSSFAHPEYNDGAINIEVGEGFGHGFFSTSYVDVEGIFRSDQEMIRKYREVTEIPEVDEAVENIINESIVTNENEMPVRIVLDDVDKSIISDKIKDAITEEFEFLCKLLSLKTRGHEIFRDWYVDGKKYYHKIIDEAAPSKGIRELRPLDPSRTKKIREIHKERDVNTSVDIVKEIKEYYIYLPEASTSFSQGIHISPDSISYCPSGVLDKTRERNVGYLHKALRPANQLKMMEDALVIYRIARAPERRVFYIDVGTLPKAKAEQHIENMMRRYKNKLTYEASTGEVRNDRQHLSMLEDYWLPRREGSQNTQIETLGGGQNLGEIEDIVFFQKKLLKALNVPVSRLEPENGFSLGRTSEITRDELKFNKFIVRLRSRFSEMFYDMLKTQLILKKIIKKEEWEAIKKDIYFDFLKDSHFTEMKEMEILAERLQILDRMRDYEGKYFSVEQIMKNVLHYDDEEIKEIKEQNEKYKKENPEEFEDDGMGGGRRGRF